MKSEEQRIEEMWNETHYGEPSLPMRDRIKLIQADATSDLQAQVAQLQEKCSAMQKALGLFRDWDDESCPDKPELSDVCSSVYAALSLVEVSNGS